jgi:putative endonuclease
LNRRDRGRAAWKRGLWGEGLAVWWLRLCGWRILARRHVTGRGSGAGEIDVVAKRGGMVAFIEIKARPSLDEAAAAIHPTQQRRLVRGAQSFLAARPELANCTLRFDALLLAPWSIPRHIQDAWREHT